MSYESQTFHRTVCDWPDCGKAYTDCEGSWWVETQSADFAAACDGWTVDAESVPHRHWCSDHDVAHCEECGRCEPQPDENGWQCDGHGNWRCPEHALRDPKMPDKPGLYTDETGMLYAFDGTLMREVANIGGDGYDLDVDKETLDAPQYAERAPFTLVAKLPVGGLAQ